MKNGIKRLLLLIIVVVTSNLSWAQPSNDTCNNATSLGSLPTPGACIGGLQDGAPVALNNQSTVDATGENPYSYLTGCSGGGDMAAPALDVWYSFVATGTSVNIAISGFPNASVGLWTGNNCNNLAGVSCANLNGSGTGTLTAPTITVGDTYYIQVSGGNSTATDNNFSISVDNDIDCDDCLRTSTLVATPAPVNGTYAPGQVVTFCYTVTQWEQTNANWFHGVQITMGPGWDGVFTNVTPAGTCQNIPGPGSDGDWLFFPTGIGNVNGTNWGAGFYFDTPDAGTDPTDNFGDDCSGTGSTWTFCWDLTVSSSCIGGQNLAVTVNTSGDGESGSWTSPACQNDPANTFTAVKADGPVFTSLTANSPICSGQDAVFDIVGTAGATISFTINGGATQTIVLDASGNATVTVAGATTNQTILLTDISDGSCNTALNESATVMVSGPVLTSLTSNTPICDGDDAVFTLVGTAGATVSYTINGGATQTVVLDGSGNGTVTIAGASANQVILLSDITLGSCSTTLTDTATVVVNPSPVLTSLTSNTPICDGDDAVFTLVGTAGATVSYTINGGATQTVVLDGSGNGTVTIAGVSANQVILLSDITLGSCSTSLIDTETVVVNPNPVLTSLTSNTPICDGDDAVFTLVGTAGATVSYTINGGATQTVVLDGSGNGTVTIAGVSANQTILLSDIAIGSCSTTLTDTETVVVNPNPVLTSLTSNTPICDGDDAVFTLVGTAGATVSYTINGGAIQTVVLDGSGNGTVTIAGVSANQVILLSDITLGSCSTTLTDTETVVVNPNPVLTSLTSNTPICDGDDAVFTLVGTAGATVSYTINGGATQTVVLDGSGNGTVTIAGVSANQVILLSDITLGSCSTTLTDTETVVVNPNPVLTSLTSNTPICDGDDAVFTLVGTAGATVSYTINGGATQTIMLDGSGNGTVTIAGASANQVILLSDITLGACSTPLTDTETVVVNPNPVLTSLTSNTPICDGDDAVFTIVGTAGATVSYTINGGATQTVVLDGSGNGTVTIAGVSANQVILLSDITLGSCSTSLIDTETVVVNPNPVLTSLTSNTPICDGDDAVFTLVGTAGATVSYTINGGATQTIMLDGSGNGTVTIAGASANQVILLSDITLGACSTPLTDTETVVVNPNPVLTSLTSNTPICDGDDAVFTIVGTAGATVSYTINGGATQTVVLDGSGNGTVTITGVSANQVILLSDITLGSCSTTLTDTETVVVSPAPTFTSLTSNTPICDGDDALFTLVGTAGATVSYTINGGATQTIMLDGSGNGTVTIAGVSANQVILLSNIAIGSCSTPLTDTETVVVNPNPVLTSLTSNTPICDGDDAVFTLVGTAGATVSYTINGGAIQTVVLDGSGNGTVTIAGASANQVILLSDITSGSCSTTLTDTETVIVNPQSNAGTDGAITICDSDATPIDLFSLITGEQSGGVWTQTSGTGGTFDAVAGTYTPASGATTSTFEYTITGIAPCPDDVSEVTITINHQPFAGTDVEEVVCPQVASAIHVGVLLVDGDPGGTWAQTAGPPTNFNPSSQIFTPPSGATVVVCEFTYTVPGTAPCTSDSATVTIIVNRQGIAGTDGDVTICETSTTPIDLYSIITGEDAGGTWSQTSGTGGTFDATTGTFTPAVGATTSTFEYFIEGQDECNDVFSVATVYINAQPDAGTDGDITVCDSDTTPIDLFSLITGEQSGGVWTQTSGTGGTFDAIAGTYTPATGATTSTFEYTLTGTAPCMDDVSVATVNINAQPDAGTDGNITVCDSDTTTIDLFSLIIGEQSGGVWSQTSGTGGTFDAVAGTYTPATGATTSTFEYTLTGTAPCIDDVSVATVNINAQPDAGTDGDITVCDSDSTTIDLFSLITGEQSGGVWTQTSGTGGIFDGVAGTYTPATGATTSTFEYTLTGTAPCIDDVSVATVYINAQPDAGTDGDITVCDSDTTTIDLFSLITGEQLGGVWTQTSGTGGTFDGVAGTYTPATGATTSTFEYTLTGTAPCIDDVSVATVNINEYLTANISYDEPSYCISYGTVDVNFSGTGTGGTYSATPAGLDIDADTGQINTLTSVADTVYTVEYEVPSNGACAAYVVSTTIEITPLPILLINNSPITLCDGGSLVVDWSSNVSGTTLTYTSSSNNVVYPSSGDESTLDQVLVLTDPEQVGDITITITPYANGCSGEPIEVPVRITPIPEITSVSVSPNPAVICSGSEVVFTVTSNLGNTTYDWQVINNTGVGVAGGVTSGTISDGELILILDTSDPLVAGTLEVEFTPTRDGCTGNPEVSDVVTVNPIPGEPVGLPSYDICDGYTTAISISSNPMIAGTSLVYDVVDYYNVSGYSSGGPVGEPLLITDVLTLNDSNEEGYVVYRVYTTLNDCTGSSRDFIVYVKPNPQPVLTDGAICVDSNNQVYQTYWLTVEGVSGSNYIYTWYDSSDPSTPIAITTDPSLEVSVSGNYYVEVQNQTTNCEGTSNTVSVIETNPATSFTTTVTDAFSDNATVVVNVSSGTGMMLYQIDGGGFQESNIFTGVSAGEHEITVIDSQGCTFLQETVLVIDYPKFFTPNGDGYNDTWNIIGLNQPEAKLYIFDRYGKLLKQISTVGQGWDGTYNGEQLPSTDYWFSLQYFENGVSKEFKAHFAMKR